MKSEGGKVTKILEILQSCTVIEAEVATLESANYVLPFRVKHTTDRTLRTGELCIILFPCCAEILLRFQHFGKSVIFNNYLNTAYV